MSDNLLCDFGQLRSPLWASLFLYSPPYLHHQHHLEACRGEILGVHFEHCPIRFVPTLQRTIPQAIHHAFLCTCCSPFLDTLPHLFLTVNSLSLRSSPEATSSGQASFLGIVGVCLPHLGSLMRVRTYSWPSLCTSSQQRGWLPLGRAQEMSNPPNTSPFLFPLGVTVSCWIAVWRCRLVRIQVE